MAAGVSRRNFLRAAGLSSLSLLAPGCRRRERPGQAELPPGVTATPGVFREVCPRWSPDGSRIAFFRLTTDRHYQLHVATPDLKSKEPHLEPLLINPDRPLRCGRAFHMAPDDIAWSPDGKRIAFPRVEWFTFEDGERLPGTGLWVYDAAKRKATTLAIHPDDYELGFYFYRTPRWSPDGKRLAFIGESPEGGTSLMMRELSQASPVIERGRTDEYEDTDWPVWSPDGRRLAFRQGILRDTTTDAVETLRFLSPGGTEAGALVSIPPRDYDRWELKDDPFAIVQPRICSISWSPDGKRIAFLLTPSARDRSRHAIYVMGWKGEARRVSPKDGRGYLCPFWLEGSQIGALRPTESGFEVVVLTYGGNAALRVVAELPTDDFDWSPDRTSIVCAAKPDVKGRTALEVHRLRI
jgi:Tol biopolymer transport system component